MGISQFTCRHLFDSRPKKFRNQIGFLLPWFKGADDLAKQARRQVEAAEGTSISWHFAEEAAADATRNLLLEEGIEGISVEFTP